MVLKLEHKISLKLKEKWHHFCFKNVILVSYLRNFKNKIVQYSQILIGGAFRVDTTDSKQLANVHFVKEDNRSYESIFFFKSMLI